MYRPLFLLRVAATTAVLLLSSTVAEAQGWLSDRDQQEGGGIKLGAYELHPGIGSEVGYTSNVFLADDARDSAALRVTPHVYLQTSKGGMDVEARDLTFRAGLSGTLKHYFLDEPNPGTDMGVKQDAKLQLKLSRLFTIGLHETFERSIDPFSDALDPGPDGQVDADSGPVDTDRMQFNIGTRLGMNSPGGLLKGGLGYNFGIDFFEGDAYRANDSTSHTIAADSSYQFLPKTAIFWKGNVKLHGYDNADEPGVAERNDSTHTNTTVGINGGLTPKVGFTLSAGYGAGFFEDDSDYESVIGQAQMRWRTSRTTGLTFGYERAFHNAFQGNFARTDRGKVEGSALFGGVFMARLRASLALVAFGADDDLRTAGLAAERDDIHLDTGLSGEYRFNDWLAATLELTYLQNFTDYEFRFMDDTTTFVDEARYDQFSAWLGVRAFL